MFLVGFGFAVLCFLGINAAMEPTSTPEFCAGQCHEMKEAYRNWELSTHGANKFGFRVECVDCHLPPKEKYFAHVFTKAYQGGKDTLIHYLIGRYDSEKSRKKASEHMPDERCTYCHDSLLTKPSSEAAREAHTEVMDSADASEYKCVDCHEGVGHERHKKLFSP
jgi:cytochrome c nitrite reductase small subunit